MIADRKNVRKLRLGVGGIVRAAECRCLQAPVGLPHVGRCGTAKRLGVLSQVRVTEAANPTGMRSAKRLEKFHCS